MTLAPIVYPTELPDKNGDKIIVSSGRIPELGPRDSEWVFKGEVSGGFLYWPVGYTSEPCEPAAPVGPFTAGAKLQFVKGNAIVRSQTFPSTSAVRKLPNATIVDRVEMSDLIADRVGRLLYMPGGSAVRRFMLDRVSAEGVLKGQPFITLRGTQDGDVEADINDLRVIFEAAPNTSSGDIPTAIQCGGKGVGEKLRRVTINRIYVEGAQSKLGVRNYWNGDGPTAERSLALFEVIDGFILNCSDGGIDTKAVMSRLERITVEGCLGNFKIWGNADLTDCVSRSPIDRGGTGGRCHFRLMGNNTKPTRVIAKGIEATGDGALLSIQNGALEFHGEGSFSGKTIVSKSDGGKLVAGSTWNGNVIA